MLKNRLGSKSFWFKQGLGILTGIKLPSLLLGGLNTYRTQADPTVRSIPLVASNPEAEFFERLKDFRFSDGNAFDFRGEKNRSIGGKTTLSRTQIIGAIRDSLRRTRLSEQLHSLASSNLIGFS